MCIRIYIITILLACSFLNSYAQNRDSIPGIKESRNTLHDTIPERQKPRLSVRDTLPARQDSVITSKDTIFTQKVDTSALISKFLISSDTNLPQPVEMDTFMLPFHRYNPVYDSSFSSTFLGNSGQASESNFFYKREKSAPFLFEKPYSVYLYKPYNTPHFNTHKPFTQLRYITSGNRDNSEQILSALHTQNINKYSNVGLLYDVIASKGIYLDQEVGSSHLNIFGSYEKDPYSFYASMNVNSIKSQENGGLVSLDDFIQHQANEVNYRVFLSDAKSRFKYYSFFVSQKLNLSALGVDSAKTRKAERFIVQHTINYDRYVKTYADAITASDSLNFYADNYYTIDVALDSAFYHNLRNRLDLSMRFAGQSQELRIYIQHEYKSYSYLAPQPVSYQSNSLTIDTIIADVNKQHFNDISAGGEFRGFVGNWAYKTSGFLYLTGYRQADISADGEFTRYFSHKTRRLTLSGQISSLKPAFFLQNYASSHFIWSNDFKNIDNIEVKLNYSDKNSLSTDLVLNYLTGYIWFDSQAIPRQYGSELLVASAYVYKKFNWGPVHHLHKILAQESTSDVVRLPALAYGNTTYYEHEVFKGALKFQIGFDFYYFLKYYADAYMPATGMFYNQDNGTIGNYPYVNAFANWRIKRTRFTLQYTNALAGVAGYDYFMAWRYPAFSGSLKFGLAWTFYD